MSKRTKQQIAQDAYQSYLANQNEPKLKWPISVEDLVTILNGPEMFGALPNHKVVDIEKDGSMFVFKLEHKKI